VGREEGCAGRVSTAGRRPGAVEGMKWSNGIRVAIFNRRVPLLY